VEERNQKKKEKKLNKNKKTCLHFSSIDIIACWGGEGLL
jgi:hypothetical protein